MLRKALILAGLFVSLSANAAITTLDQSGTDPNGANLDKTTIIYLPSQGSAFNFEGALDSVGSVLQNNNTGAVFGLYLGDTLVKGLSFFNVDTTKNIYSFNFTNLAAGDYNFRFNIDGNTASRAYSFASTITTVTTPVPEPESLSLLVMGLGLLGLMARRKA